MEKHIVCAEQIFVQVMFVLQVFWFSCSAVLSEKCLKILRKVFVVKQADNHL